MALVSAGDQSHISLARLTRDPRSQTSSLPLAASRRREIGVANRDCTAHHLIVQISVRDQSDFHLGFWSIEPFGFPATGAPGAPICEN